MLRPMAYTSRSIAGSQRAPIDAKMRNAEGAGEGNLQIQRAWLSSLSSWPDRPLPGHCPKDLAVVREIRLGGDLPETGWP